MRNDELINSARTDMDVLPPKDGGFVNEKLSEEETRVLFVYRSAPREIQRVVEKLLGMNRP